MKTINSENPIKIDDIIIYKSCLTTNVRSIIKNSVDNLKIKNKEKKEHEKQKREAFKKINKIEECSVCYDPTCNTDQLECGHYCHLSCLKKTQEHSNKLYYECPVCMHELSDIEVDIDFKLFEDKYLVCKLKKIGDKWKTVLYILNSKNDNLDPNKNFWILSNNDDKINQYITDKFKIQNSKN